MAVPNPERELERLRSKAKGGLGAVTVITGASGFFRGQAVAIAVAAVPAGSDLRSVEGQVETDGGELQHLRGASLFGGGWLVVRRGDAWLAAHDVAVLQALQSLGRGCGLIVEAQKLDRRTKLGKALAGRVCYEFRDLYDAPYDR